MSDVTASRAVAVTLFEDRAEVVRRARVALAAGQQWLAVAGLSPFVDDRSLIARVGGATVTSVRVRRRVRWEPGAGGAEVEALEGELRAAEARVAAAEAARARAAAALAQAEGLLGQWTGAAAAVPRFAAAPERLAEWREAWSRLAAAADADAARAHDAEREALAAGEAADRAELRLHEALQLTPRRETLAEVQVDAPAAVADAELELVYRVPCALWRPEHLARLVRDPGGGGARIELTSFATAWQASGERWEEVEARFSTARTARSASAPLIDDDALRQRKKSDEEKKRVVVEARDQSIAVAGLDRGVRAVDEMPGVDDGGEPLSFAATGKVSLAGDGRPFRIELSRVTLAAEVELVLLPERTQVAHLRARATLARAEPLLAGPVRVARDASLVGRAKLDFVAAGEAFELGFGADDGLRVRREQHERRETGAIAGTQRVHRSVKLWLSNLSGEPRRVHVTERIPVSEIEEVEIRLDPNGAWRSDDDGLCHKLVDVPARATASLELGYEIKAAAKVVLPF